MFIQFPAVLNCA